MKRDEKMMIFIKENSIKVHGNEILNGHCRVEGEKSLFLLTPGYEGSPQRFPNDTIPSCTQCESISSINGPPLGHERERENCYKNKTFVLEYLHQPHRVTCGCGNFLIKQEGNKNYKEDS